MNPQILGIHHVTAVTANARENHHFYTQVLGMRLVKKTVNQDDVSAYHLFYADAQGSPGSDLTFFDWAHSPRQRHGNNSVSRTGLRVGGVESLQWWIAAIRSIKGCPLADPGTWWTFSGRFSGRRRAATESRR